MNEVIKIYMVIRDYDSMENRPYTAAAFLTKEMAEKYISKDKFPCRIEEIDLRIK